MALDVRRLGERWVESQSGDFMAALGLLVLRVALLEDRVRRDW